MHKYRNSKGFSLTEMLIAAGIMAVGLVMVATIFPVGVKLTSLSTERSVGAVAADEGFAKVRLYGLRNSLYWPVVLQSNPYDPNLAYYACSNYEFTNRFETGPDGITGNADDIASTSPEWAMFLTEFCYPSEALDHERQPYHWSALCRRIQGSTKEVQVTVFVSRKTSAGMFYVQDAAYNVVANSSWPTPVKVAVEYRCDPLNPDSKSQLIIKDGPGSLMRANTSGYFFRDGYTIVDDYSGRRYKILDVEDLNRDSLPDTLTLTEDWKWRQYEFDPMNPPASEPGLVWVVPPAVGSDRYPCVGVYQKVLPFDNLQ